MAAPWLDGLSEEWNSDPHSNISSSPPTTARNTINGATNKSSSGRRTSVLVGSSSRIPHLAQHLPLRVSSSSTNRDSQYLRLRSAKGRLQRDGILAEKTANSLNVVSSPPSSHGLPKQGQISTGSLRRPSSSQSENSVQHHSIDSSGMLDEQLPDWKKRLVSGADLTSDGFDLFSPSKLESVFKQQSSCPVLPDDYEDTDHPVSDQDKRPWTELGSTRGFPAPKAQNSSKLGSTRRSRAPTMDVLEEQDEDEIIGPNANLDKSNDFDLSAISSDIPQGSIRGLVKRHVSTFETALNSGAPDPRYRTLSGQVEIANESISPVTNSRQTTIRTEAVRRTLESNSNGSRRRPVQGQERPRSSSSDHGLLYDGNGAIERLPSQEEELGEMTSQSLPEDLSMGTQMHNSFGIENRGSLVPAFPGSTISCKPVSNSSNGDLVPFQASNRPQIHIQVDMAESSLDTMQPGSENDTSVLRHEPTTSVPIVNSSPLKVFGQWDTFTNNKLNRFVSQYEDGSSHAETQQASELNGAQLVAPISEFRISNFGDGQIDAAFEFSRQIEPSKLPVLVDQTHTRIFGTVELDARHAAGHEDPQSVPTPAKVRSPKRRRTVNQGDCLTDVYDFDFSLAGKKRKDALPGQAPEQVSPESLAQRHLRRPSGSRKISGQNHSQALVVGDVLAGIVQQPAVMEIVAAELETFAKTATKMHQDSRKPSLATKDYMEEAQKVMQMIRAKGKPVPIVESLEGEDSSELDPDKIMDLELDEDDSTKDSFDRPPSREGRSPVKQFTRVSKHDTLTAEHLRKYRDVEDFSSPTQESCQSVVSDILADAALVPIPEVEREEFTDALLDGSQISNPPGIRIVNVYQNDLKRKHSGSVVEHDQPAQQDSSDTRQSNATVSTSSSSGRGLITHGTITIPETVGTMTFDQEKGIWVKKYLQARKQASTIASPSPSKNDRHDLSEADPFEDIPDLSIDESREAEIRSRPSSAPQPDPLPEKLIPTHVDEEQSDRDESATPLAPVKTPAKSSLKPAKRRAQSPERPLSAHSAVSRKEEELHDGKLVDVTPVAKQQARVVTIAFSSPVALEIPYLPPHSITEEDLEDDDPSYLPLDDEGTVAASSPCRPTEDLKHNDQGQSSVQTSPLRPFYLGSVERHRQYRAMTLPPRTISRIQEQDERSEEGEGNREMSLIHILPGNNQMTPLPDQSVAAIRQSGENKASILCLTPLSDFTLHQNERIRHPEESFIAERPNDKALHQVHGSHALVENALVQAIQDAEPGELFWERLKKLVLRGNRLSSLYGLARYCSTLESLDISCNRITQLGDVPITIRSLDVNNNLINDLSRWNHLQNLQVADVSHNQLENLDAFSGLVHLRRLKASSNGISNIRGLRDLDALVELDLSCNNLNKLDFDGYELSSLEVMNLSKNQLERVRGLEHLPQLRKLNVDGNHIRQFHVEKDSSLLSLQELNASDNELTAVDVNLFPALHRLNLDGNHIQRISNLSRHPTLAILSVRAQKSLTTITSSLLSTSHDLTVLQASYNPLSMDKISAHRNHTLRHLELAACGLESLLPHFGQMFPNLRTLNLNFNGLHDLSPLQGLGRLEKLEVAENRLSRMRRTCLVLSRVGFQNEHGKRKAGLKTVDLRGNPITVGFYRPAARASEDKDVTGGTRINGLPRLAVAGDQDAEWDEVLDEKTLLRKRAMQILLAKNCKGLEELDGRTFDHEQTMKESEKEWAQLVIRGVLKKTNAGNAGVHMNMSGIGNGGIKGASKGKDLGNGFVVHEEGGPGTTAMCGA